MVDIKISLEELKNPKIDAILEIERSLNSHTTSVFVENVKTPLYLNPAFYYSLASCLGSILIWAIMDPYYDDSGASRVPALITNFMMFGPAAGVMSLFIGITYGMANRNYKQSLIYGISGLGIGLGVTIVTSIIAGILFGISIKIALKMGGASLANDEIKGTAFFILMCGRGVAWSVISCGAGLSLGILLKSKKMLMNGLAGGLVGGALGGLSFDPVGRFISGNLEDASLSRAVGFFFVGALTGLFIGIFENINKESWLLMVKGPLAGKQFIIFKSPIFLGSAPKCEIYLFKDPSIEPKHATIVMQGKKYLIEDLKSEQGTFVNGKKLTSLYVLQAGDVITLGETVLKYQEKQK